MAMIRICPSLAEVTGFIMTRSLTRLGVVAQGA